MSRWKTTNPERVKIPNSKFDLVIFDCDGVLVDSELIFARVLGECLVEADFPATTAEAWIPC